MKKILNYGFLVGAILIFSTGISYARGTGTFAVTPEPSTLLLLGTGAAGFIAYKFKNRSKK